MTSSFSSALKAGTASFVLGVALLAVPAFAQDASAAAKADKGKPDDNVIIVTGSIVRNASAATASPVTSLTATDLANRGIVTVEDALQQLPANNAGTDPANWSAAGGFATGASAISLRGFNDSYTLTLFNDLRTAYYPIADDGYRQIVDINTIPDAIVDHIDVLQDGASSTYGSDAVAGVVNVIVKKEIKGLHLDMSDGISQRGDSGERRITATWGFGSLRDNGYNFYANVEYQKNDPLFYNQRDFPENTANHSTICDASGSCEANGILNGIQAGGGYNGFQETTVGYAAPYNTATGLTTAPYQMIAPGAGCQGLSSVTLTAAQQANTANGVTGINAAPANGVVCQQDTIAQYQQYAPDLQRLGGTLHFTADVGSHAQFYAMANFYQVKTAQQVTAPRPFDFNTAAGGTQEFLQGGLLLPVYVCPGGVGGWSAAGYSTTTCTAGSPGATLNPNNPFAASGTEGQLSQTYDKPEIYLSDTKTYRFSAGINGSFGKGWNYDVEGTTSWIDLGITYENFINAQHLLNLVATGGYNFLDQSANSQATDDYLAPTYNQKNSSRLTEFTGSLNKDVFTLPGGPLNIAVGAAYRFEGVNNPSPNPPNAVNPYDRYFDLNAVSVIGSRRVYSGFYEVAIPILDNLRVKADGRYDSYSVGGSAFAPKFEAEFTPIKQVKLRGTYSRGFHAPTLSELFEAPVTGYVTGQIACPSQYPAFCAAHGNNPSYYLGGTGSGYSFGETTQGNTSLKPEKSEEYTFGTVLKPDRHLTFTVDYWHTKITNIIVAIQPPQAVFDQYYENNGVTNVAGFATTEGAPDPLNPAALPLLGTVTTPFVNAAAETGSGIDFTGTLRLPLNNSGLRWTSSLNASYLAQLKQLQPDGVTVQYFAGTLSPCNITSCSGAPRWRGIWSNTLDFSGKGSVTLTADYTSGYSDTPADIPFVQAFFPDGNPVRQNISATFDLDLAASVKIADRFTLYGNIINLLNSSPVFDPTAEYSLSQFNPAWDDKAFIGRYFRVGAKVDF